jgi:hypothetical protein
MYIHRQARVRYRTLCNTDAPDRAISPIDSSVTCPICLEIMEQSSSQGFAAPKKVFMEGSTIDYYIDAIQEGHIRISIPDDGTISIVRTPSNPPSLLREIISPIVRGAKLQNR